nr:hypothetical protein [Tanacetum cinerariifolium]
FYYRRRRSNSRNRGSLICSSIRVVIPFRSSFGLVIVLPGRVLEPEDEAWLQLEVEESRVDEPKLGKPELDKLEVGFDHVKLPGRIGFFPGCSLENYGFLDSCFDSESYGSDCFGFDFG